MTSRRASSPESWKLTEYSQRSFAFARRGHNLDIEILIFCAHDLAEDVTKLGGPNHTHLTVSPVVTACSTLCKRRVRRKRTQWCLYVCNAGLLSACRISSLPALFRARTPVSTTTGQLFVFYAPCQPVPPSLPPSLDAFSDRVFL